MFCCFYGHRYIDFGGSKKKPFFMGDFLLIKEEINWLIQQALGRTPTPRD